MFTAGGSDTVTSWARDHQLWAICFLLLPRRLIRHLFDNGLNVTTCSARRSEVLARSAGFTLREDPVSHILNCKRAMSNSVELAPLLATREDRLPSNSPRWQAVARLL